MGVKYKASYGGSGKPFSIMASIESYLEKPLAKSAKPAAIEEVDSQSGLHRGDCSVLSISEAISCFGL